MNTSNKEQLLKPVTLCPGQKNSLTLPGNIFLAPLAGWTDPAFRSICLEWGANFTYTEMVSAEACYRQNKKTLALLARAENEPLLGVQLFTSQSSAAIAALPMINQYRPTLIDLNCGCSIPKILRSGAGAALLQEPARIKEIVKAIKEHTNVPVTVKIRSGWDQHSINFIETSEAAIAGGASLITLHPRTRTQGFGGRADWTALARLKHAVAVPVIGSGDLFTAQDVKVMLMTTGCDGVMLARGTMGNPFIFKEINKLCLSAGSDSTSQATEQSDISDLQEITSSLRLLTALKQLKLDIFYKGEKLACKEMRKHFCAYSKGISGSASFRQRVVNAATLLEYEKIVADFLQAAAPQENPEQEPGLKCC